MKPPEEIWIVLRRYDHRLVSVHSTRAGAQRKAGNFHGRIYRKVKLTKRLANGEHVSVIEVEE